MTWIACANRCIISSDHVNTVPLWLVLPQSELPQLTHPGDLEQYRVRYRHRKTPLDLFYNNESIKFLPFLSILRSMESSPKFVLVHQPLCGWGDAVLWPCQLPLSSSCWWAGSWLSFLFFLNVKPKRHRHTDHFTLPIFSKFHGLKSIITELSILDCEIALSASTITNGISSEMVTM